MIMLLSELKYITLKK